MIFRKKTSSADSSIKYIVAGLGNPGEKYTFTRHNAGFLALDYIAQKYGFKINDIERGAFTRKFRVESNAQINRILFIKPQTFMNNSGTAISECATFYRVPPENILVVFDDISLPPGKMRVRRRGSDGGHNGIKSIIYHLKSDNFPRIKIGVGEKPHPDYDLADWVTSKFRDDEKKLVFDAFIRVYEAVDLIIKGGSIESAMNKYN